MQLYVTSCGKGMEINSSDEITIAPLCAILIEF